ncbi:hypothetical protein SanaruYs_34730 [Chryseotalea sanaruensis]|uniref:JmjC domain-containing protein n=1 Tax=Chryseotalea sanaruensis TaxID=2482724 RepID=A0A401UED7_9BACT|nr:cupin-like domain-containing protein [Chryseotalea sanaruensis]GCC53230.1 hypothetical protein SanaruYs_34730 [Chryseotalea sanaruensis]
MINNYLNKLLNESYSDRVRVSNLFNKNDLGKEPIVFTDVMKTWPSYPKWNFKYLSDNYGKHQILADRVNEGRHQFIETTFSNFITYMINEEEANPYYGKSALHLSNGMKHDYFTGSYFVCWYREWYRERENEVRKLNMSNLYLGPRNAKSPLHIDIWGTSFWNALFVGKKLWVFFNPNDEKCLYNGKVDPFDPDLNLYPLFEGVKPIIHVQQPGELIYCPGNIWHAIYVLEPSLALSENFINEENYLNVLNTFKEFGYTNAYQKMLAIVDSFKSK